MKEAIGDGWDGGSAYERYMGRWSRLLARQFIQWLSPHNDGHWLEVGCGSGALTAAICDLGAPASVVACDQSASFVEHARSSVPDSRVSFVATVANEFPRHASGFNYVVSGLVLNFIPNPVEILSAMRDRIPSGGTLSAYIWDYAGGVEFLRYFWEAAVASDANAAALDEAKRFGEWQPSTLASLFGEAGLRDIETATLTIPTVFAGFDDYWNPFLGDAGPAPKYVSSLPQPQRDALSQRLHASLPVAPDGSIPLRARALAVRGKRT